MAIYAFTRPGQMVDHNFTDDVAICEAKSHKEAKEKFSTLYAEIKDEEVWEVKSPSLQAGVVILTDY